MNNILKDMLYNRMYTILYNMFYNILQSILMMKGLVRCIAPGEQGMGDGNFLMFEI